MLRKFVLASFCVVLSTAAAWSQTAGSVVDYSFYLPATVNGYLYAGASTTDAAGNTYIAGTFPYVLRQYGQVEPGFFVAKYNHSGQQIFYKQLGNQYFGGYVNGIAVDGSGDIYLTGEVSGSDGGGLTPVNAYQSTTGSPYTNAFFCVLSADGSTLTYATYFGGNTQGNSVAVDSSGNAYISGVASYGTFSFLPTTTGAPVTSYPSATAGFVAKFNPKLSGAASLIYSTFLGTTGVAIPNDAVAVDSSGSAYVTGNATSVRYPVTAGAYAYNGRDPLNDVFVTKINPTGTAFVFSALLGPGSGNAIVLDSSNNVYVAGTVYEDDYPTTSNAYQATYPSGFVTELNAAGSALVASTFLGGPNDSYASVTPTHIALPPGCASNCPVYVAGYSSGSDLPLVDPVQSYVPSAPASKYSAFYTELAGGLGSVLQSSYFASGSGFDQYQAVPGIGVDSTGNIYLVGDALPSQLPVTQAATGPTGEGFLAKIAPAAGAKIALSPTSVTFPQQIVGIGTAQEGLAPQIVQLENLGTEAAAISSIKVSTSAFSQTNNCNGSVPAGGYCTLTLGFTPSAASTTASPQTGNIVVASSNGGSTTVQLSGTAINDRFIVSSCGGATPCAGLTFADTVVGSSAATTQIVTLTNLGGTSVPFSGISVNVADYNILTNCPRSGTGLAKGKSCEVSVQFQPTQVGLRPGTLTLTSAGTIANTIAVPLAGTGLLSPNPSSLVLMESTLNFGTTTVGATSATQTVTIFNNGSAPATVFAPTPTPTGDAAGVSDYAVTANGCAQVGQLVPEASCTLTLAFSPTATGTRSGTLTIPTSASSTPLTSSLTGIGVAEKQTLEFTPDAVTFAGQVIDTSSGATQVNIYNVGPAPVSIDRVLISGQYQITVDRCSQTTLAAVSPTDAVASCYVQVVFSPTSTGAQSGTLTVIDTEGKQSALSLAGTGLAQNGSILLGAGGLNFGTEPVGTTANAQDLYVTNVGDSPVTVTAVSASGDYATGYSPQNNTCAAVPFTLQPNGQCGYGVYFTPSKVANPDNGTFTLTTSAGTRTASLSGIGEAASKIIVLTPSSTASYSFGDVEVGQTAPGSFLTNVALVSNTGTDPVTFSTSPTITGTNASDFGFSLTSGDSACGGAGTVLNPGVSCVVYLDFKPSAAGARNATLTITDDATTGGGVQTLPLTGTGTSAEPAYSFEPESLAFYPRAVATASPGAYLTFVNNGASPVTISSIAIAPAGNFAITSNGCTVAVRASGGYCELLIQFSPTTTGALTSTVTLTDSEGHKYTAQLYGYGTPTVDSLYVTPLGLVFGAQPQLSKSGTQQVLVYNYGTQGVSYGQVTGTNVIVGSSTTGAFAVAVDGCSNRTLPGTGTACGILVELSPTATTTDGSQAGSLKIPVTYGDGKTGSYTVSLSGTVVAPTDAAELSPTVLTFLDQPVNTASGVQYLQLTNSGNLPLTIGALTSTNTGASGPFVLGAGNCGTALTVGTSCVEPIKFSPTTAGSGIKGTLSFPITYADGKTKTLTASYSGNAIAAKNSLVISPDSASFGSEVVGQSTSLIGFTVTNNGNQPVAFGPYSLMSAQTGTNFIRNYYDYNSCSNSTLAAGSSCTFNIAFTPTLTGTINGTLTIGDGSATGGPHKIPLTGIGLSASQAIAVSQKTVNFGSQPVGGSTVAQAVYLSNQSASSIGGFTYTLGGTNASDFTLHTNSCGGTLSGTPNTSNIFNVCSLLVLFNPATASLGDRTATVTVAFTGSGSPIVITLNGKGVPPSPAVTLFPSSLTYPIQSVGVRSSSQVFSVTNTGSASLSISKVTSVDAAEFPITTNGCGATLAPGANCLVQVAFDPSAAGARTGTIQLVDNATSSPQTLTVSGTGQLAPEVTLSSTTLTFASQNVGSVSASQAVTVTNNGTASLAIGKIAIGGADPGDFTESGTCGSTLAVNASCTLSVGFAPKAAGSRTATLTLTDNNNDVSGATQSVALSGTGVGVPVAGVAPASVAFGSVAVGSGSAPQTVTLTNSGTAALAIGSIALSGGEADNFTETNGCPASLAAGANCAITVVYKPAAAGAKTASLVVTDNNGLTAGSTQTAALSGTGLALASKPTFSPAPGTYSKAQSVTLADTTSGAIIYYTTDGTTPTTASKKYTGAISVTATQTINAIATASGFAQSPVATGTYTIQ
jgi:hypothetical protein